MIRLSDLLWEGTPADDAERMGLERKPGFGNYGPPGSDTVTHRSRGGKLVPVADTKGIGVGRGAGKATPSGTPAEPKQPDTPKPTPPVAAKPAEPPSPVAPKPAPTPPPATPPKPSVTPSLAKKAEEYKARADARGGARKLANIVDTMADSPLKNQMSTLFAQVTTADYVKKVREILRAPAPNDISVVDAPNTPIPFNFMDLENEARNWGRASADGVFDPAHRNIWMSPVMRKNWWEAQRLGGRSWQHDHVLASHVLTHELVHTASPRTQKSEFTDYTLPNGTVVQIVPYAMSHDLVQMEEAMTEIIARDLSKEGLAAQGVQQVFLKDDKFRAYDEWVIPARLMAVYGGLDIYDTFWNVKGVDNIRAAFWKAEDNVLEDLLLREVGIDEREMRQILDLVHGYELRNTPNYRTSMFGGVKSLVRSKGFAMFHRPFFETVIAYVHAARTDRYDEIADVPLYDTLRSSLGSIRR